MKKLQGKWALVTGSSRGIGQQVAVALAAHGCNIIVHGRTEENCAPTMELLEASGVEYLAVSGELGTPEGEEAVISAVREGCPQLDILYNNAAVMNEYADSAFTIPEGDWERVFEVNVFAMARLCNAFVPGMVERGWGRVVNVSSGIRDIPQLIIYSATKAAVDKYTRDLATELKGTGVIASTMDPGWIKTDMGGAQAENEIDTVLPGAIVPVLIDDRTESGRHYSAQDYRCL